MDPEKSFSSAKNGLKIVNNDGLAAFYADKQTVLARFPELHCKVGINKHFLVKNIDWKS